MSYLSSFGLYSYELKELSKIFFGSDIYYNPSEIGKKLCNLNYFIEETIDTVKKLDKDFTIIV